MLDYSRIRRYKRPSFRQRLWWQLQDHFTICNLVLFAFCIYLALHIAVAARAGTFGPLW